MTDLAFATAADIAERIHRCELQAVGAAYHDHVMIEFARLLAQEIGGFEAPPGH